MMMTMMTMKSSIALLLASLVAITTTTSALDVEITDVHCNANYAITASMFMTCYNGEDGSEESSRCTFGTEATLTGQIYFAGLEYTNVVNNNNIAGLYGTLYAPTGTAIYDFANAYEISLCDETLFTPIEDDLVCPADGTYLWNSPFVLPNSEYLDDFWASGWEPYATLQFEDGAGNLIGDCKISMMTYASATNGSNESSNNPLSQMATGKSAVIAMLVLIGVFLLLVIYCCFCCQKKKTAAADENKETEFTRMDDKPAVNREQPAPTPVGGPAWTAV